MKIVLDDKPLDEVQRTTVENLNIAMACCREMTGSRDEQFSTLIQAGILIALDANADREELKRWLCILVDTCPVKRVTQ